MTAVGATRRACPGSVRGLALGAAAVVALAGCTVHSTVHVFPPAPGCVVPEIAAWHGATRAGPPNTVPAIEGTTETGGERALVDVRFTADHVPVLHHAPRVEVAAGRRVPISKLPEQRVTEVVLEKGVTIPTLEEALATAERADIGLMARIWPQRASRSEVERAARMVEESPVAARSSIVSRDTAVLRAARHAAPHVGRDLVRDRVTQELVTTAEETELDSYVLPTAGVLAHPEIVRTLRDRGMHVWTWTEHTPHHTWGELTSLQVHGIIADSPAALHTWESEHCAAAEETPSPTG